MSSSHQTASFEPWIFTSTFASETDSALTRALQQSFTNHNQSSDDVSSISLSPFFVTPRQNEYCSTSVITNSGNTGTLSTVSGSGSEPETPGSIQTGSVFGSRSTLAVAKATKRKSRASKRSMTTFIQADPANFRQMVQQVTGVKLDGNLQVPVTTVVKPEPHRRPFANRLSGLLPTLDTSAYLLDGRSNRNGGNRQVAVAGSVSTGFCQGPVPEVDIESFCSFPTLESWN